MKKTSSQRMISFVDDSIFVSSLAICKERSALTSPRSCLVARFSAAGMTFAISRAASSPTVGLRAS
jgi:hypothetical protein